MMPEYVIISGQWYTGSPCFSAGNDSCSPGWTIEAEAAPDLKTLVERLGGGDWHDGWRGLYETPFINDRRLIGVWSLKTGKRVEVKFETRERSEPETVKARKWTERRVVVEP
jgi:hypothetical protein